MKKKLIITIISLVILFIINLTLYYSNKDYEFFIKKIKNPEEVIYTKEKNITDEYKVENIVGLKKIEVGEKVYNEKRNEEQTEKKLYLGEKYKDIIKLFGDYDLKEIELKSNLFDITNEYPDDYFEFYSKNLNIYLFYTKKYEEIKSIFEIISYESPFSINEVNNFGNNSFYINLEGIEDNSIRVIVNKENIVFGLKIKKDEYNNVKQILKKKL